MSSPPCAPASPTSSPSRRLGRGMRLPFGSYTEVEILDTLEVVAHERYEDLLKKAGVLNEAFIDYRTRAALRVNAQGETVVVTETDRGRGRSPSSELMGMGSRRPARTDSRALWCTVGGTSAPRRSMQAALKMKKEIARRADAPTIVIPVLRMTTVRATSRSPTSRRRTTSASSARRWPPTPRAS